MKKKYVISKSKMYNRCVYYLNNYNANSFKLKEIMNRQADKYYKQFQDDENEQLISKSTIKSWQNEILASLKETGYLNDFEFGLYLGKKFTKQGKSILLIKRELYAKGVENQDIEKIINVLTTNFENEEDKIINYAKKKKIGIYFEGENTDKIFRKHVSHLQRRGYSYDLIAKIVKKPTNY